MRPTSAYSAKHAHLLSRGRPTLRRLRSRVTDRDTDSSVTWNLPPQPWYAPLLQLLVSKPPPAPEPRERAHSTMRSVRRAAARRRSAARGRAGSSSSATASRWATLDHTEYSRTPDWRVELTPKGREQARGAGEALRALNITGELLCVYSSPYMRCQQTLAAVLQGAGIDKGGLAFHRQEPRLREQDFGNFQDPASVARRRRSARASAASSTASPTARAAPTSTTA